MKSKDFALHRIAERIRLVFPEVVVLTTKTRVQVWSPGHATWSPPTFEGPADKATEWLERAINERQCGFPLTTCLRDLK